MVTICTKTFCRPTIQDLILAKIRKKREDEDREDFFNSLKLKREAEKQDSVKILAGLPVPNSTFRSLQSAEKTDENNSNKASKSNVLKSSTSLSKDQSILSSLKSIKKEAEKESLTSSILLKPEEKSRTSSLLSGTNTLEELKELRDLLHKSSYVPQQKKPRRSTIEKIKIAIEKEKERQASLDKCQSTINASIESSDASTSTEEKKKKKKVKKPSKTSTSPKKTSITSKTSNTVASEKSETTSVKKGKKVKGKKKISNKINVDIQVSIIKSKNDVSSNIVKAQI